MQVTEKARSERGRWKSTRQGNSLTAYSTARLVLNGGREETGCKVTRLAPTQLECGTVWYERKSRGERSGGVHALRTYGENP